MAVLAPPVVVVASGAPPFVHVPSGAPPFVVTTGPAPPIQIVASGAPPITLFNEDGSLWAGANVGGAALLVGETDGFATDFTYATDASRVAVKVANVNTSYALDAFFLNSGTSPKLVYDVAGTLGWSPHNPVQQSQTFDNAAWLKVAANVSITADAIAAPDGTLTADKFQNLTTTTAFRSMLYNGASITTVAGETYTISVYAKAAEWTWLGMESNNLNTDQSYFDLANGVLGNRHANHTGSAITSIGNGWYRCSITFVAGASHAPMLHLHTANGQGTVAGVIGSGIYVWGAQLNRGATPLIYLPTTSATRVGVAIDYDPVTHAIKGLLTEPPATNLLLNNATLSTQSVTVSATAYTLSFLGTGTVTLTGVSTAGPLVGTGASNRVSLTFTPTAGSLTLTVTGTVNRAQLETGTAATSPIPTFGASATRAGDFVKVTPTSINYSATAGSWWIDVTQNVVVSTARIIGYVTGTYTPVYCPNATTFSIYDGVVVSETVANAAGSHKLASAFQSADRAITADGLAVVTNVTAGTNLLSPGTHIGFGCDPGVGSQINGYIRKVYYLPRRMTNPQLVSATT